MKIHTETGIWDGCVTCITHLEASSGADRSQKPAVSKGPDICPFLFLPEQGPKHSTRGRSEQTSLMTPSRGEKDGPAMVRGNELGGKVQKDTPMKEL